VVIAPLIASFRKNITNKERVLELTLRNKKDWLEILKFLKCCPEIQSNQIAEINAKIEYLKKCA